MAITPQQVTLTTKRVVHFIAESLLYPVVPITRFYQNMRHSVPFRRSCHISVKELVPVTMAAALWGPQWSGKHICFHSDNMAVVAVLQRRSSKSPPLMQLLRCVSLFSAFYGFHFSAKHVPGVLNEVADALSHKIAHTSSCISQVPKFLLSRQLQRLLISERPDWGSQSWTELFSNSLIVGLPNPPRKCTSQVNDAS